MNPLSESIPISTHSITAVARELEVSVETLRMYERKGLVLIGKNDAGQRVYTDSDVERLRCIRRAITEGKISIEGIRKMHSMIPCWKFRNCTSEQRAECPAYGTPVAGCWTYAHEDNACSGRECRSCKVYLLSADCEKIKELVHGTHSTSLTQPTSGFPS